MKEEARNRSVLQKPESLPDYIVNDLLRVSGKVVVIKGGRLAQISIMAFQNFEYKVIR